MPLIRFNLNFLNLCAILCRLKNFCFLLSAPLSNFEACHNNHNEDVNSDVHYNKSNEKSSKVIFVRFTSNKEHKNWIAHHVKSSFVEKLDLVHNNAVKRHIDDQVAK